MKKYDESIHSVAHHKTLPYLATGNNYYYYFFLIYNIIF